MVVEAAGNTANDVDGARRVEGYHVRRVRRRVDDADDIVAQALTNHPVALFGDLEPSLSRTIETNIAATASLVGCASNPAKNQSPRLIPTAARLERRQEDSVLRQHLSDDGRGHGIPDSTRFVAPGPGDRLLRHQDHRILPVVHHLHHRRVAFAFQTRVDDRIEKWGSPDSSPTRGPDPGPRHRTGAALRGCRTPDRCPVGASRRRPRSRRPRRPKWRSDQFRRAERGVGCRPSSPEPTTRSHPFRPTRRRTHPRAASPEERAPDRTGTQGSLCRGVHRR